MDGDTERILAGLNAPQREAVTKTAGPVLVIAGPGSGKTRALTHRIAYLLTLGVSPREITAVTFTNKAADEIRDRVLHLLKTAGSVPESVNLPFIGTFHGFCASVLRKEARFVGLQRNFTIYDEGDAASLLKEIAHELGIDPKRIPTTMAAAIISDLKNELIAWDEYEGRSATESFPRTIAAIYETYQKRLLFANAADFDDLVFHTVRLFQANRTILSRWQACCRYLLIDEYQDTSTSQYELVRLLAGKYRNIFAIGDDAQSIYRWRKADYRNILNFERDWPDAKVILLEENYRSTPEIISAANALIQNNIDQKAKKLWTRNPGGEPPLIVAHEHGRAEAAFIADEISARRRGGKSWSDFAVLYRTNAQSRALEEALLERDIPYAIIGGVRFFERREVKDLLAYLRYLQNPNDALALKRIVNVPARGIGPKTLLAYLTSGVPALSGRERENVLHFEQLIKKLRATMTSGTLTEFFRTLIRETAYERYLEDTARDSESRIENIRELVSLARRYDALPIRDAATKLLDELALASETDDPESGGDRVKLMTLHAAKGLEFPVVFITGLEEGLLPHQKAIASGRADLEEERRLAYVGITRAREWVCLTWALQRTLFGEEVVSLPSRFLRELPPEIIEASSGARHADEDLLFVEDEP